jgi:hypothetical protein
MLKNLKDKVTVSGISVLMVGVALLIFTFISAYLFLTQSLSILASSDLVRTFGEALAPLIATCIRIMYLGVMGWIGSLLTIRGVTIIAHAPQALPTVPVPQKPALAPQKPAPAPQKAKAEPPKEVKPEAKPPEPEMIVIPPEQVAQPPPAPAPEQKEPQKNETPPNGSQPNSANSNA